MSKIRSLKEIVEEFESYEPGWKPIVDILEDGRVLFSGIDNPAYGEIERIVVCRDDGSPLFDQYQILEGPLEDTGTRKSGGILVPYFQTGEIYVGLIERGRQLVMDEQHGGQGDVISTEFPRGFAELLESGEEAARRELREETGAEFSRLDRIGKVNPNTAFYAQSGIPVYAAEIVVGASKYPVTSEDEPIFGCSYHALEDVRERIGEGEIFCGLTLAAWSLFDAYLHKE